MSSLSNAPIKSHLEGKTNGNNITEIPVVVKNIDKILNQQEAPLGKIKLTNGELSAFYLPVKSKIDDNKASIVLKIGKGEYKFELLYNIIEDHVTHNIMSTGIKIQKSYQIINECDSEFKLNAADQTQLKRCIMINILNFPKFNPHL